MNKKNAVGGRGPTEFESRVYKLCASVPQGKVTTYGAIARKMKTKAFRAVGMALHRNPFFPSVPCFKVISSNGSLGGFRNNTKRDLEEKIQLLEKEGIEIKEGKIDLERYLYTFK